jgi:hypothetical protein
LKILLQRSCREPEIAFDPNFIVEQAKSADDVTGL